MRSRLAWLTAVLTFIALPASAAPGDLDASFGGDGVVLPSNGAFGYGLTVQPDGAVVVVGASPKGLETRAFVLRLLPGGKPDPSFGGGDGYVSLDFGEEYDSANDVAVQPNGRIVVVGTAQDSVTGSSDLVVVRLTADGHRDRGFNGGGVFADFGWDNADARAVQLQDDGRIVVAGWGQRGTSLGFVLRLQPTGRPDTAFSKDGRVVFDTQGIDMFWDVVVTPAGRIVAGGSVRDQGVAETFAAVAFTPRGALDPAFGGDGVAAFRSGVGAGTDLALGPGGTILVGGPTTSADTSQDAAVARFTKSGGIDRTFDGDGLAIVAVGTGNDETLGDIVVQPDGRVLVVGDTERLLGMVVRLKANGARDGTFGVARGSQFIDVGTGMRLYAGALDGKERLVATGYATKATVSPVVARLLTA